MQEAIIQSMYVLPTCLYMLHFAAFGRVLEPHLVVTGGSVVMLQAGSPSKRLDPYLKTR